MKYHEEGIQKFERQLRLPVSNFSDILKEENDHDSTKQKKRVVQHLMSHNWGRRRNRLRKGKRGITSFYGYGSRATYRPVYNKHSRKTPEWGALRRNLYKR